MPKPDYDTTLARMAGNIAAGLLGTSYFRDLQMVGHFNRELLVRDAILIAQDIVEELRLSRALGSPASAGAVDPHAGNTPA